MKRRLLALAGFTTLTTLSAVVGARVTQTGRDLWYRSLEQPPFQPPAAAFGPVWTALYAAMTVSAYRVWKQPPSRERTRALQLWGVQLALNAAWTPLFFGAHAPRWALADIGLLLGAISAYALAARRVDRPAAWMMTPYLAWTAFATVLNAELVRRNLEA